MLSAECCPSSSSTATTITSPSAPTSSPRKNTSGFMTGCSRPELPSLPILLLRIRQLTRTCCSCTRRSHTGDVFTISLHQENNYPAWKPPSSIDVNLPDEIGDDDYLAWLDNALSSGLRQFDPELLCYIAGADPYREDQLGGLALTIDGLKRRDELVFRMAKTRGIPVMVTLAGGYARIVDDTVTIHCNTVIAAKEILGGK